MNFRGNKDKCAHQTVLHGTGIGKKEDLVGYIEVRLGQEENSCNLATNTPAHHCMNHVNEPEVGTSVDKYLFSLNIGLRGA